MLYLVRSAVSTSDVLRAIPAATPTMLKKLSIFFPISAPSASRQETQLADSYCRGHLVPGNEETIENIYPVDLPQNANISTVLIPKAVLKDIGKCTEYILQFALGFSEMKLTGEEIKTCELDEWGEQLLKILFEGQSVRSFNMAMFLDTLKTLQDETYYSIVSLRWKAIQSYLLDDVEKCIQLLEKALDEAKNKNNSAHSI